MAVLHTLYREQVLPTNLSTAWAFISRPENLNRITPPELNFEICSPLPDTMFEGLLIEYRIGIPLLGKRRWLTEIKHIRERKAFVDEQRIGPYKLWYHRHEIAEVAEGVRFTDLVHFALPFGPVGQLAYQFYVKQQLQHIFNYRGQAMRKIFGTPEHSV